MHDTAILRGVLLDELLGGELLLLVNVLMLLLVRRRAAAVLHGSLHGRLHGRVRRVTLGRVRGAIATVGGVSISAVPRRVGVLTL